MLDRLRSRTQAASRLAFERSLRDMLPNVAYTFAGEPQPRSLSSLVVAGTIGEVQPGFSWTVTGGDDDGTRVEFGTAGALWSSVHFRFQVDRVIAGAAPAEPIVVGFVVSPDEDLPRLAKGLADLGRVVLLLGRGSPVFSYDPALYSIARDGDFLGLVEPDDRLTFPALADEDVAFLGGMTTFADLVDASEKAPVLVEVKIVDGIPTPDFAGARPL